MTQTSINYARVLYELSVSPESIKDAKQIIKRDSAAFADIRESGGVSFTERKSGQKNL